MGIGPHAPRGDEGRGRHAGSSCPTDGGQRVFTSSVSISAVGLTEEDIRLVHALVAHLRVKNGN